MGVRSSSPATEEQLSVTPASSDSERVPRWALVVATALALAGLAAFIWGRGGTPVLVGVALLFAAVATLLVSLPDGDPSNS